MTILESNDIARLEDSAHEWIIIDILRDQFPTEHTGETHTVKDIKIEFILENDKLTPKRVYYPKDQFKRQQILQTFQSYTNKRRKRIAQAKKTLGL